MIGPGDKVVCVEDCDWVEVRSAIEDHIGPSKGQILTVRDAHNFQDINIFGLSFLEFPAVDYFWERYFRKLDIEPFRQIARRATERPVKEKL